MWEIATVIAYAYRNSGLSAKETTAILTKATKLKRTSLLNYKALGEATEEQRDQISAPSVDEALCELSRLNGGSRKPPPKRKSMIMDSGDKLVMDIDVVPAPVEEEDLIEVAMTAPTVMDVVPPPPIVEGELLEEERAATTEPEVIEPDVDAAVPSPPEPSEATVPFGVFERVQDENVQLKAALQEFYRLLGVATHKQAVAMLTEFHAAQE